MGDYIRFWNSLQLAANGCHNQGQAESCFGELKNGAEKKYVLMWCCFFARSVYFDGLLRSYLLPYSFFRVSPSDLIFSGTGFQPAPCLELGWLTSFTQRTRTFPPVVGNENFCDGNPSISWTDSKHFVMSWERPVEQCHTKQSCTVWNDMPN